MINLKIEMKPLGCAWFVGAILLYAIVGYPSCVLPSVALIGAAMVIEWLKGTTL